ncbi:MAG: hypothetical protein JW700_02225 [Candidatus Aenigmarchaeota archaeon]|nr:hypothetical protein [Candidatus Aenigmarchaeota archaeon]
MKGISLVTTALVLIVIAAVVLIAFIMLIGNSKGQVDIIQYDSALRNCCNDRSRYDCGDNTLLSSVTCRVPWGDGTETLENLVIGAGFEPNTNSIKTLCNC